jgi:hypothetical protein
MNRLTTLLTVTCAAAAILPANAYATDTIVNINGADTGCTTCNGAPHPVAGDTVGDLINPVLQTFAAGTYTVTNGVGLAGATPGYDAWRFNGSEENWIWSFIIVDPATHKVVLDSLPDANAFVGTHSAVANASYALSYSGSFTLAADTQLAFITEDYYPYDNAGGVALRVSSAAVAGVPEPATWAMMLVGFGAIGGALRGRQKATARVRYA